MSFDLENDNSGNNNQLSLFDYKTPQEDFVNSTSPIANVPVTPMPVSTNDSTAVDLNTWLRTYDEPENNKTGRFLTLSATIHLVAILATAMITIPIVEQAKTETISIEIQDVPSSFHAKASRGEIVPPTQGGTPIHEPLVQKPKPQDLNNSGNIVIPKSKSPTAKLTKTLPAKISVAKTKTSKAPTESAKTSSAHGMSAKTNFKAVPLSIEDIEAPELDSGALANSKITSNLNEDYDDDFSKVNQSHQKTLDNEKKSMDSMAAAVEEEQNQNLNALDEANNEEKAKFAAIQNSAHQKNAKGIASALASEQAAAAAAAAAKEASSKKGGLGGHGNGFGMGNGEGTGNTGNPTASSQLAGLPNGVRSLEQLRQVPGNPRPQYDNEERHRGDQGSITYFAYINKAGVPTNFRLMKSTGFNNLDTKTLEALKKWRFYPGQEGWVELPFRWDLKGGVQQDGGLLRRKISRR
ncbi:MAG: energy transducer TonB [Pseudobdellovibrionaceae bacterium]